MAKNQVLADGEKAIFRIGARKLSAATRDGVATLLKSKGMKTRQINNIINILETDLGKAGVSFALGTLLVQFPGIGEDPRVKKMCEELRIESMTTAGESMIEIMKDAIGPGLKQILAGLPKLPAENHGKLSSLLEEVADKTESVRKTEESLANKQEATARK